MRKVMDIATNQKIISGCGYIFCGERLLWLLLGRSSLGGILAGMENNLNWNKVRTDVLKCCTNQNQYAIIKTTFVLTGNQKMCFGEFLANS